MKVRGVVATVLLAGSLLALDTPKHEKSTEEFLKELFDGVDSYKDPSLHMHRFIDLESLLEDSPELENQYTHLSQEEKEELVDTIDEFNETIAELLAAAIAQEDESVSD